MITAFPQIYTWHPPKCKLFPHSLYFFLHLYYIIFFGFCRYFGDFFVFEERLIKEYITAIPRKKKETVFGIFIGYSIDYKGESDSNDEYDRKIIEENIQQVLRTRQLIIEQIIKYSVNNYEFNFYFLPFHNAMRDRRTIMQQLTRGKPYFTREDIRNG